MDFLHSAENNPLLDKLEKQRGEMRGDIKKSDEMKKESLSILKGLLHMFEFTSGKDKFILFIGTIFTIIHGASFPVLALLFGSISETFIVQSYGANHNASESDLFLQAHNNMSHGVQESNLTTSDILNKVMGGNATGKSPVTTEAVFGFIGSTIAAFGPQKPLSKDEFVDYAEMLSFVYLGIGAVVFISSFLQTACWEWVADNQAYRMRSTFLYQILRQDISWFETNRAGNLIVKLADDVERFREGVGHKFSIVLEYCACFAFGAFFGLSTNWKLAMIFGTSVPFIVCKILIVGGMISGKAISQQEEFGRAGALSAEVLSSVRTVAAFNTEINESTLYNNELQVGVDKAEVQYTFVGLGTGLLYAFIYGAYAVGFWYACNQLTSSNISPRQVYTVFFCVSVSVLALANILAFVSTIAIAFGSCKVVQTVIDSTPTIDTFSSAGRTPKTAQGKINFTNVNFHYPSRDNVSVMRNLTLEIKPGDSVAIVGPSGAGKSTFVNLLLRFYDPESGQITFDDVDLKSLNLTWLRDQLGVVAQTPEFDTASIYDNIVGDSEKATTEDVHNVAKLACAHDFIMALPEKYDTRIGLTGRQMSTGQKQRLALARVLLRNPKALILDEATSGLNVQMARTLYKNVKQEGRTVVSISHRLSHIQKVDVIYVLKGGSICEFGSHEELLEKKGTYYNMVQEEHILETLEAKDEDAPASSAEGDAGAPEKDVAPKKSERAGSFEVEVESAAFEYDAQLKFPTANDIYGMCKEEELGSYTLYGFGGAIICGCIAPLFALVFSELFITFSETGDQLYSDGMFWMKIVIAIGVVCGIGIWARSVYVPLFGEYFAFRLRSATYLTILRQAIGWFDDENNSVGRIYTRLASDAPYIKVAIGTRLGIAVSAFVSLIGGLIIAFILEWQLGVIILSSIPVLLIAIYIQGRFYEKHQMVIGRCMESALRLATKVVLNIWNIQALNLEPYVLRRFKDIVDPAFREAHKQSLTYAFIFAFTETVSFVVFAGVFWVGAHLIDTQNLDAILLFKVFIVMAFCTITVAHVTSFTPDYVKAKLAMAHIFSLYDMDSTIDVFETTGEEPLLSVGKIAFDNVVFAYPTRPNVKVLQGATFDVKPGTSLGIIGVPASGKSTVLSLLERFYDIDSGSILIDGVEVKKAKLNDMRYNIGFVAQEPLLFDRSVNDNIKYGYAGDAEGDDLVALIKTTADKMSVTEFAQHLPSGFDTEIGEKGARLTGGQRQRIAIARAIMRDPLILLLDEPTSALDPEDELLVQKALKEASVGRTTVIASNRPSTIRSVDRVAVLVNGKIAEFGTHEELNELKGFYYDFMKASQQHA